MTIRYVTAMAGVDWARLRQSLIDDNFHNGRTVAQYQRSFEASYAAVIAYEGERPVGTARMISDGVCNAYIVDVWTDSAFRNQGIARRMMTRLELRAGGQHICLWTESAQGFYERCGYHRSADTLYEKVVGQWLNEDD